MTQGFSALMATVQPNGTSYAQLTRDRVRGKTCDPFYYCMPKTSHVSICSLLMTEIVSALLRVGDVGERESGVWVPAQLWRRPVTCPLSVPPAALFIKSCGARGRENVRACNVTYVFCNVSEHLNREPTEIFIYAQYG